MQLNFIKMSGAGNDFIVIDNRDKKLNGDLTNLISKICQRRFSIGADGVLMIENSDKYDFRMRYYNSDGGEAEMCGNGGRCIAKFAYLKNIAGKKMRFESMAGAHKAEITGEEVKLGMIEPFGLELDFDLSIDGKIYKADFLNTGVPHVAIFTDELEGLDVVGIGRKIRFHKKFQTAGTNVNFVKVFGENKIKIRTYERGVEDETLACGTGATAAAIISYLKKKVASKPVVVQTLGGFDLTIYFDINNEKISDVFLCGNAEITFEGFIDINFD